MLPEEFLERMKGQLGDEYAEYLQSLERPRAVALRFNPLKGELPQMEFVQSPVPWEPMGYYYDPESRPGLHPYHEAGVYYLQEASAMSAVALLDPNPVRRSVTYAPLPAAKLPRLPARCWARVSFYATRLTPNGQKSSAGTSNEWGLPTP